MHASGTVLPSPASADKSTWKFLDHFKSIYNLKTRDILDPVPSLTLLINEYLLSPNHTKEVNDQTRRFYLEEQNSCETFLEAVGQEESFHSIMPQTIDLVETEGCKGCGLPPSSKLGKDLKTREKFFAAKSPGTNDSVSSLFMREQVSENYADCPNGCSVPLKSVITTLFKDYTPGFVIVVTRGIRIQNQDGTATNVSIKQFYKRDSVFVCYIFYPFIH